MNVRRMADICVVALMLMGSAAALANNTQGPPPRGGGGGQGGRGGGQPPALPDSVQIVAMVDELHETLDLSTGQKEQVTVLYFTHFEEVEAAMNDASGNREDGRKKMESLRSELEAAVKALLSDDQQAAFDEYAKSRRPGGRR